MPTLSTRAPRLFFKITVLLEAMVRSVPSKATSLRTDPVYSSGAINKYLWEGRSRLPKVDTKSDSVPEPVFLIRVQFWMLIVLPVGL